VVGHHELPMWLNKRANVEGEALGSQRAVGHPKTTSMVKSDKATPRLEKWGQQIKERKEKARTMKRSLR